MLDKILDFLSGRDASKILSTVSIDMKKTKWGVGSGSLLLCGNEEVPLSASWGHHVDLHKDCVHTIDWQTVGVDTASGILKQLKRIVENSPAGGDTKLFKEVCS